jgi:hypothetical protein
MTRSDSKGRSGGVPPARRRPIDAIAVSLCCTDGQGIIGTVSTKSQDAASQPAIPPIYADRSTGQVFVDATAMVNAYLARFSERAGHAMQPLDENGYTQTRKGSATIGLNVLDDHGLLLLLAPVMPVPQEGREAFYRRLLELSFLTTADAAFAIDAAKDEVFVRALRRLSGLDYEEFEDLLDTVGRVADEWDDALKREFGRR